VRVVQLWRYPVKSLQGEQLETVTVDFLGLTGDRSHGILDLATGMVLTGRRDPSLLMGAARYGAGGSATVVLPDGGLATGDGDLSAWIGRPVRLEPAASGLEPTFEADAGQTWGGPPGAFHDDGRVRVSLLGTGTIAALGQWDVRRFRPNIVLDGDQEDGLIGRRVRVGGVILEVVQPVVRCVMVTRPQPGGIDRDLDVLRTIQRARGGTMAVGALAVKPGEVRVGDDVEVLG
jgi:uncharacterized protein YcbX